MPWQEASQVSLRREFVALAVAPEANISQLCRRFGISRKTGYKWLARAREDPTSLEDRSRRPHRSPTRTARHVEAEVCGVRREHPTWSGYKIRHVLLRRIREGRSDLREGEVPAASTCTEILNRHDLVPEREPQQNHGWQRFEADRPNDLWQIDFKGNFRVGDATRVHPLTVLDDHSRFSISLKACSDASLPTVQGHLTAAFRRYGLPNRILADNGPPWGAPGTASLRKTRHTQFTVWLFRLGVSASFSRPFHPQTLGKDERFHRTLGEELLSRETFQSRDQVQAGFDDWRAVYNLERPHQGIDMQVPADRYRASPRAFPEQLPPIEYEPDDLVRKVSPVGLIRLHSRQYNVGAAFAGLPIALRPGPTEPELNVYFCHVLVARIDIERGVAYPDNL